MNESSFFRFLAAYLFFGLIAGFIGLCIVATLMIATVIPSSDVSDWLHRLQVPAATSHTIASVMDDVKAYENKMLARSHAWMALNTAQMSENGARAQLDTLRSLPPGTPMLQWRLQQAEESLRRDQITEANAKRQLDANGQ